MHSADEAELDRQPAERPGQVQRCDSQLPAPPPTSPRVGFTGAPTETLATSQFTTRGAARSPGGNIFGLLVGKITDIVLNWAELLVNGVIEMIENVVCGWFGCNLGRVCLVGGENVYRCQHSTDQNNLQWMLGCGFRATTAEAQRCYFARQRSICMDGDPSRYNRYQKLFDAPPKEELEEDFWEIAGVFAPFTRFHIRTDAPSPPKARRSTPSRRLSTPPSASSKRSRAMMCGPTPPRISAMPTSGTRWTLTRSLCAEPLLTPLRSWPAEQKARVGSWRASSTSSRDSAESRRKRASSARSSRR